ncbi:hypothetical protein [Marinobacter sediminum]|uniref:hypothetical protein n=1 Tax=Marinobacter sediminum TaxID=256323 RepID=UPI00193A5209|nr:hypothetical protein [Marinobacter sediminum]
MANFLAGFPVLVFWQQVQSLNHRKKAAQWVEHDQDQNEFRHKQGKCTNEYADLYRIHEVVVLLGFIADGKEFGGLSVGPVVSQL